MDCLKYPTPRQEKKSVDRLMNDIHYMSVTEIKQMSPRRARKRQARIESILQAALDLATEDGLDRLTTHRLADRLDLVVGALYRYFPSKEALITALEVKAIREYGVELSKAWREAVELPLEGAVGALAPIVTLGVVYQRLMQEQPAHFHLINLVVANPKSVLPLAEAEKVLGVMHSLFMDLAGPFDAAIEAGALAPGLGTERIILFWSSTMGVLQVSKLGKHDPTIQGDRLLDGILIGLLGGWGADRDAIREAIAAVRTWQATAS